MKRKDWFWCGAVLCALTMFVSLQSIQEPLYSGMAGGLCALIAAILFGGGLRADAREKSATELKRVEEEQEQHQIHIEELKLIQSMFEALKGEVQSAGKITENESQKQRESIATLLDFLRDWFNAQQQSYAVALNQLQRDFAAAAGEIQTLRKAVTSESQSQLKALVQLSTEVRECFMADRTQAKESAKSIRDLIAEQCAALCKELENLNEQSTKYYGHMIEQPWPKIGILSETLQSMADQVGSIQSAVDSIQSDTEKQIKKALDRLKEDSQSLQEKLRYVCETLEKQGQESRDAMDQMMQGYSNITAQDIEVLTALARDTRL